VWPEIPNRVTPMVTELNEFFWKGGADGILRMLACEDCGRIIHPPSPRCPYCLSARVSPRELSGRGVVLTYTVNYQPFNPAVPVPYVIAIVTLDEQTDLRIATNIVDCEPDSVCIGLRVEVRFERQAVDGDDVFVPVFAPRP